MGCALFRQQVIHVSEVFVVPSLVTRYCDSLNVFLDSSVYHFSHAAVVAKMNDFASGGLENSAHDVDSRIMPVKKTCRGNYADLVFGPVRIRSFVAGEA